MRTRRRGRRPADPRPSGFFVSTESLEPAVAGWWGRWIQLGHQLQGRAFQIRAGATEDEAAEAAVRRLIEGLAEPWEDDDDAAD